MPTIKLTKSNIGKLAKPAEGEELYWDHDLKGFGLRVALDRVTFIVQGRIGRGRGAVSRRWTIGEYGKFTPDQARQHARQLLSDMVLGKDPRDTKASAVKRVTLREVAEEYMQRSLAEKTKADYHKMLAGPLSRWADKPLASIDREDVLEEFRKKKAEAPAYATIAFQTLKSFFNYAMNRWPDDFPQRNPVKILKGEWAPKKARTDRIPDDKLSAVWKHLQDARTAVRPAAVQQRAITAIDLVSFLLLTGARINEAAGLTWDRVNLDAGWWHIPSASAKNRNSVWLPLPTQAVELLKRRQRSEGYVFATPQGRMKDPRKTMAHLSKIAGCELSPHSLRRSWTNTGLRLCRIELWKIEGLTNHVSKGVTLQNYSDTQHFEHLQPEVQQIADRIVGITTF